MKAGKRLRRGCALALAVLLGLSCLVHIRSQAAGGIETGRLCTLTVSVEGSEYKEDFNEMKIPVSIYRVADVDVSGRYTPVKPFEAMNFSGSVQAQLRERFGIQTDEAEADTSHVAALTEYAREIMERVSENRKNYLKYIESLQIQDGSVAFFDFVAKGTSQMFIQNLVPNHLKGLYFLQLEKENMFTVSVLQRCHKLISELKEYKDLDEQGKLL